MPTQSFKLRGRHFELDPADVEARLRKVEPKPLAKYQVRIAGQAYPPKQVLSVAIGQPLVNFTTMDAARILKKIGFDVTGLDTESRPPRTVGEELFESYLERAGLTDFQFEASQEGSQRTPDYSVDFLGQRILFEVKQFDPTAGSIGPRVGAFDPYGPIREKIEAARKQFKDLRTFSCNLVLFNNGRIPLDLDHRIVFAAMLGNMGLDIPVNTEAGVGDMSRAKRTFQGGGKMLWYEGGQAVKPKNTTISSIVVLRQFRFGQRRFQIALKRKEAILGRTLDIDEFMEEIERARGSEMDLSVAVPRLIIHENPVARIPLPDTLFLGPLDERYALRENRIVRVFRGEKLAELEREEKDAAPAPPGFHPVPIRGESLSATILRDRR